MRAFVVIVLLIIVFLLFTSKASSNVDLTPGGGSVKGPTPTHWAPIATITMPSDESSNNQKSSSSQKNPPAVVGVPVTGGQVVAPSGVVVVPQVIYPQVVGIPVTGAPANGACTNPYIVQNGDTLSKIATRCGTTLANILALNPSIYNIDVIFPGQGLWLYPVTGAVAVPVTAAGVPVTGLVVVPTPQPGNSNTTVVIQGNASSVRSEADVTVKLKDFPANTPVNIGVGQVGMGYQIANQGITDAGGNLVIKVKVPRSSGSKTRWEVIAVTTAGDYFQAASQPFTIK